MLGKLTAAKVETWIDCEIMILDKAEASQFFERRKHIWGVAPARAQDGKTINSPKLLRGCGKWGHCARCAEQRDERAALHVEPAHRAAGERPMPSSWMDFHSLLNRYERPTP